MVIFGIGPCYSFGSRKRVSCEKRAQVINFMSQVSSSATCQSFLELIRKGSVPWHWSFSYDFHWNCINYHSLRWSEKIPETWGGLETAQRDFQAWVEATLYVPWKFLGFLMLLELWEVCTCPSLFHKENSCLNPGRTSFQCTSGRLF